jgi:hypothetical protein
MSLLERIHTGRRHSPPRLLMYGTEGIGKSTTAAQAPNPIFIPTEDGLDQIDCASFPLAAKFADVESALAGAAARTARLRDRRARLRRLAGAFDLGRAVRAVRRLQHREGRRRVRQGLHACPDLLAQDAQRPQRLRNERGMCVILLAHAKVEKFEDPEHSAYDRYSRACTSTPRR